MSRYTSPTYQRHPRGPLASRLVSLLVSLVLVVNPLNLSPLYAQTTAIPGTVSGDTNPPVISLEEVGEGIAGEVQVFTAEVTDDGVLTSVVLYHRFRGDERYASTEMRGVAGTAIYSASVITMVGDVRPIEYYVQAVDTGGNRAIRGFVFDPLVRNLGSADTAPTAGPVAPEPSGSSRKILWGVLGLLAIAAIAGAAGGGSSSGGTPPDTRPPVTIDVTPQ